VDLVLHSDTPTPPPPPPTQEQQAAQAAQAAERSQAESARQQTEQMKLLLCKEAAACEKCSQACLDCAAAGNFKTCLRFRMGDDASYSGICSGYQEGGPAVQLPPETPDAVDCFFRTLLK
jgi:hypothetical protein